MHVGLFYYIVLSTLKRKDNLTCPILAQIYNWFQPTLEHQSVLLEGLSDHRLACCSRVVTLADVAVATSHLIHCCPLACGSPLLYSLECPTPQIDLVAFGSQRTIHTLMVRLQAVLASFKFL